MQLRAVPPADDHHLPAAKRCLPDLRPKRAVILGQFGGELGEAEAGEVRRRDFEPPPGVMALNREGCPYQLQARLVGLDVAIAADDRNPICAPVGASVPVAEPCWMRASKCPLGPVPAMWTLLAACRAAAAACSTSAGDFFSRPLVGGPVAVVAPPHAPMATVTSAAVAV